MSFSEKPIQNLTNKIIKIVFEEIEKYLNSEEISRLKLKLTVDTEQNLPPIEIWYYIIEAYIDTVNLYKQNFKYKNSKLNRNIQIKSLNEQLKQNQI